MANHFKDFAEYDTNNREVWSISYANRGEPRLFVAVPNYVDSVDSLIALIDALEEVAVRWPVE